LVTGKGLLPLARHYSYRKCNNNRFVILLGINIVFLGRDYCLILNRIEKNHRDQKALMGLQLTFK
jgi:hypothetical protein